MQDYDLSTQDIATDFGANNMRLTVSDCGLFIQSISGWEKREQ